MLRRTLTSIFLGCALLLAVSGCRHAKVVNPIAGVDSKQPDKQLFDRAMKSMAGAKYGETRTLLETLINTYPDSEYVARAKMSIGDAWNAEGGTVALQQAEAEYRDFITFFPDLPEAAEAQLKIANIHYRQMEKYDRDYAHAIRAEEEYKEMVRKFPNSALLPEARQKLRNVQEVLAQRQFSIARFYFLRNNLAASQARLISLVNSYPLYSGADEALFTLGDIYEKEAKALSAQKMPEAIREKVVAQYQKRAIEYYSRILTRYPAMRRADDARQRLEALKAPVPTPTAEALALNQAEEDSRDTPGRINSLLDTFKKHPNTGKAAKAGEPSLTDPEQTSAVAIVQQLQSDITGADSKSGPSAPIGPGTTGSGTGSDAVKLDVRGGNGKPEPSQSTPTTNTGDQPLPPPQRVNEIDGSTAPPAADQAAGQPGADKQKDSTSEKKKKKGIRKLIPF